MTSQVDCGPSQGKIQAGHESGHGAACSIAEAGTDGHGGALGDMTLRAVTDLSFRNYTYIANPLEAASEPIIYQ